MDYKHLGTISKDTITLGDSLRGGGVPNMQKITDSSIAGGNAALTSELEKRDPLLREPLTSVTYPRDMPITTGGGFIDTISAMHVNYGVSGGSGDGVIASSGSNSSKVIQANVSDEKFGAHIFDITMRIPIIDMLRAKITGRSLDQIYNEGVRLAYDKHMDQNTYVGMPSINTFGLLNDPGVVANLVTSGKSGSTVFISKTADEVLNDINNAIVKIWNQAENSLDAMPNHILLPYEQYNYLATTKVSDAADKTILTFIKENNIAKQNGTELFIGGTNYCRGAGIGKTDRMVVYVHNERFLKMEELVSLYRAMTSPNTDKHSYDTLFLANISEVQKHYYETIGYFDGI